jgi:hypothetical protein
MDMKRISKIAAMTLVTAGIAASAFGGQRGVTNVVINDTLRIARGTVSGARNSLDNVQIMQCSYGINSASTVSVVCMARDAAGTARTCITQNPQFVNMAATLQGDSILEFRWDADGRCTSLSIVMSSTSDPKALAPVEKRAAN